MVECQVELYRCVLGLIWNETNVNLKKIIKLHVVL
jgi:hypothetical protein